MSLAAWLAAREPPPPAALGSALGALTEDGAAVPGAVPGAAGAQRVGREALAFRLVAVGRERLEQALARPGRVRESAFRLLEADALLTYACEAVLEAEEPVGGLRRILAVAGR